MSTFKGTGGRGGFGRGGLLFWRHFSAHCSHLRPADWRPVYTWQRGPLDEKWICTNLLPNYEEQIWYWRFYWSRSTKDPTDPHWFFVVVLPSQVFLKQICSLQICRKYAVKTEELAEVYFFQSYGSPLQLSTDLRIFLQWLKDLCPKKI